MKQNPITIHQSLINRYNISRQAAGLHRAITSCPGIVLLGSSVIKSRGCPPFVNAHRIRELVMSRKSPG